LHYYGASKATPVRIPVQVEKGKEYNIEIRYRHNEEGVDASLDIAIGKERPANYSELVDKLRNVDVVIFAGGINSRLEGEEMQVMIPGFKEGDRTDIELPLSQRNCLKALKAAGKKVILVNCSGSAMGLVPETESCDAILQAWYAGESGGQAIADALFGDYNPSGRLPITFYKNIEQLPDFEDYSMNGRTYRYMTEKPLFPFGYGLSYTTFAIGEGHKGNSLSESENSARWIVPVTNTGKRNGAEVIQVYVRKLGDNNAPNKSLRAYKRVELKAGETKNVEIELSSSVFDSFDSSDKQVEKREGKYELLYGVSSDDKDLKSFPIEIKKEGSVFNIYWGGLR
jgi:beta-glucosidase